MANLRQETTYNKLIGRQGDEYYFLKDTFEYKTGNNGSVSLRGATGVAYHPVSREEYNRRIEEYDEDGEQWRCEVAMERTKLGHDEWRDMVIKENGDSAVFNISYGDLADELREKMNFSVEEYPVIECVRGGRCFDKNETFDEVYDEELLKIALSFEESEKEDDLPF